MSNQQGFELFVERVLKAPPAKIWRCWTEPDLQGQWFCPKPWRAEIVSQDLRPGGWQAMVFHGPDGEAFDLGGVFLEIVPEKRLISTNAFAEGWIPVDHPHPGFPQLTFLELADAPGGGTLYKWGARHWTEAHKQQHEAMGFHDGWNTCVDQLDELSQRLS